MVSEMDYGYVNARVRGMKGALLDSRTLQNLINKPDLDSLIAELEKTSYRQELERAGVQYSGITRIEVALRKDIVRSYRKILNCMEEDGETYLKIILHRWDVQNIKTILRGKRIQATPPEIMECLIPAGELDEAALTELVKQPDVKAVIDLLATWRIEYSKPLTSKFKEYAEKRDMAILEYALDLFYYENAFEVVRKGETYNDQVIRNFLLTEIDVTNIKTALRVIQDRMTAEEAKEFFIKGGIGIDIGTLLSMIRTGTIEGAVKLLDRTRYKFLGKVPAEFFVLERISAFEKELDKFLIKKGTSLFFGDPLSIAIAVAYIWAKYNEVTNIRIIARGKTGDVSEKELREALISV